ncbi:hypothetical protein BaRGS_00037138 [Batillaria attramentaria]|uniref:Uncharacterized protein n=1 Tax=Batillaria attramentaria TaxID=370345 RepID=A0ABD0J9H9_9CAEN
MVASRGRTDSGPSTRAPPDQVKQGLGAFSHTKFRQCGTPFHLPNCRSTRCLSVPVSQKVTTNRRSYTELAACFALILSQGAQCSVQRQPLLGKKGGRCSKACGYPGLGHQVAILRTPGNKIVCKSAVGSRTSSSPEAGMQSLRSGEVDAEYTKDGEEMRRCHRET